MRPQVFVAMSFAQDFQSRYEQVFAPAIRAIPCEGGALEPNRVDFTKTGDSILTEIIDGIAHCKLFLADVSVIGKDSKTCAEYRNGNVMYEVGLAVTCRQPSEVLLVRDDRSPYLFDVSTIPHEHVDFTDVDSARNKVRSLLEDRIHQIDYLQDARVQRALASLSNEELIIIRSFSKVRPPHSWGRDAKGTFDFVAMAGITRLLDKGVIRLAAQSNDEHAYGLFSWTELGIFVVDRVVNHLERQATVTLDPEKLTHDRRNERSGALSSRPLDLMREGRSDSNGGDYSFG